MSLNPRKPFAALARYEININPALRYDWLTQSRLVVGLRFAFDFADAHPVAYLNSGSILRLSLVLPGNTTFLSANLSVS